MATQQSLPSILTHFFLAQWRWRTLRGEHLERYQETCVRKSVAYALQHSPFYRQHWSGHDPDDWRTLPTVHKALMMEHFSTFNTVGIQREEAMELALQAERSRDFSPVLNGLTVGLSSGTSGHRGLFLVSTREQAAWAGTILARALHDLRPRRLKIAFFLRSNSNLYEQVGGRLLQFRYFDLMQPLEDVVVALNEFQPVVIVGPPSLLAFLAAAHEGGGLRIVPERLISVAEVLEPHEKERLENVFAVPVHQIYQCTEGLLAVSCAHGSLHIQEDIVALQFEPLERSGGANEQQRVMPVVTDLWRRTQPIVRYRLNDILQLASAPCSCGSAFRVIQTIEGRCDDMCYFSCQDGKQRPFFPDTLRRMILLAHPGISDYLVVQEPAGNLHISLTVPANVDFVCVSQAVRESVLATLAHYQCHPVAIQIEEGMPFLAPGVKRRRVQRLQS